MRAASFFRNKINETPEQVASLTRTFGDVIVRYEQQEMPARAITKRNYEKLIRVYIRPTWGATLLIEVKAQSVRTWLKSLDVSTRYRGHIHGMMRLLFRFAMLWEWLPTGENPMSLFHMEGASKRTRQPKVLTPEEFKAVLAQMPGEPYRTMVIGAMCLGLRCSELLALKWGDFDFLGRRVRIQRGIVEGKVDRVKTQHSEKPLPLHPLLAEIFLELRARSEFRGQGDWVFASPRCAGELPFAANNAQLRILRPAGERAGLSFRLGWHCFRHTYKTRLDEQGVPLTVQRDLMRHADIRTTAQVYGDVHVETLRSANSGLVESVLEGKRIQ